MIPIVIICFIVLVVLFILSADDNTEGWSGWG